MKLLHQVIIHQRREIVKRKVKHNINHFLSSLASSSTNNPSNQILAGVDTNTAGGGVWAQTSSKRNKLNELKALLKKERNENSLDDVATPKEKQDLHFSDGLMLVSNAMIRSGKEEEEQKKLRPLLDWLERLQLDQKEIDEISFKKLLEVGKSKLMPLLSQKLEFEAAFSHVTDFLPYAPQDEFQYDDALEQQLQLDLVSNKLLQQTQDSFNSCVLYIKLSLFHALLTKLDSKWDSIMTITNSDMDRAAVSSAVEPNYTTIPIQKLYEILHAYLQGSTTDQLKAWWALQDKDNDSLLDQEEMDAIVYNHLETYILAYSTLFPNVLHANYNINPDSSWRERRRQRKHLKLIHNLFKKVCDSHYDIEVETPHRLRCIYAWAEKQHQGNKMDSILVDSTTTTGKKRYVELEPKISFDEFHVEQALHFKQLDSIGYELCFSLREEFWLEQGRKRQNKELRNEMILFFVMVTLVDAAILLS